MPAPQLALPYADNLPARSPKRATNCPVACHIALKLSQPKREATLWRVSKSTSGVSMPETSIYELAVCKLWYAEPNAVDNTIGYAKFYSRSHHAVIRVFDAAGAVIKTEEHAGDFRDF